MRASCLGAKVAIEPLTSGIFAYEYLDERGIEVHLAHPVYLKPFAKKHVKTDKVEVKRQGTREL